MNRDDNLWKTILEEVFDDFLLFFYPDASLLFDLDRGFEYLDKELAQLFPPAEDQYATRYVDKLVKVFAWNGTEEWLLVHIEVQGQRDKKFAKRMFEYYYRILDKYDRPVTAFAIFSDADVQFQPGFYERETLGTKLYYEYNTFKIIAQEDDLLKASDNPFALVVLTAKAAIESKGLSDDALFGLKREIVLLLKSKGFTRQKQQGILNFLKYYIRFGNQKLMVKFEQEIERITGSTVIMTTSEYLLDKAKREGIQEGIQEGKQEGIQEGKKEGKQEGVAEGLEITAIRMLRKGFDILTVADLTTLPVNHVQRLTVNDLSI